jgi:hypothetical protein
LHDLYGTDYKDALPLGENTIQINPDYDDQTVEFILPTGTYDVPFANYCANADEIRIYQFIDWGSEVRMSIDNLSLTATPTCTPEWQCTGYTTCVQFKQNCNAVIDEEECGTSYAGNYSEFSEHTCGTVSESTGAAHQANINPNKQQPSSQGNQGQTFSIAPLENARISILQWINNFIMSIRRAVGLEK